MTSTFFQEFKTFTTQISQDTENISNPKNGHSKNNYNNSAWLLNDFNTRIENFESQVDNIKNNPAIQTWSFEMLFNTLEKIYEITEKNKHSLENHLQQYGYKKVSTPPQQKKEKEALFSIEKRKLKEKEEIKNTNIKEENIKEENFKEENPKSENKIEKEEQEKPSRLNFQTNSSHEFNNPCPLPILTDLQGLNLDSSGELEKYMKEHNNKIDENDFLHFHPSSSFQTPKKKKEDSFGETPATPNLADFGISSFSLQVLDHKKQKENLGFTPKNSFSKTKNLRSNQTSLQKLPFNKNIDQEKENQMARWEALTTPTRKSRSTNLFPFMDEISQEEYDTKVPKYLREQVIFEELNKIIVDINDYFSDLRFGNDMSSEDDYITESDLRDEIGLGSKSKAILLLLIQLKRMYSQRKKDEKGKGIMTFSICSY